MEAFDLEEYADAVVGLDAERWLAFYDAEAEWIEYRHADPPRSPHVMCGVEEIGRFLRGVCAAPLAIEVDNLVADDHGAAFTLTVTRPDEGRIIENVILEHRDGRIVRQIDVEAWDPPD